MGGSPGPLPPVLALVVLLAACSAQPPPPPDRTGRSRDGTASPIETASLKPSLPFVPAADCEDATVGEAEVTIRQDDDVFLPDCLVVLGGQSFRLRNIGTRPHNFSIEGAPVNIDVQPGSQATTDPVAAIAEPGTYTYYCRYHRDRGMEGDLTVTPAG
jgi:plastocyanin